MLGVFAEFETNLRRERQLRGDRLMSEEIRLGPKMWCIANPPRQHCRHSLLAIDLAAKRDAYRF
jgi:hypothetical protein